MSLLTRLFVSTHKFLYRVTDGRIGSNLAGIDHLLLTTLGRKSGERREHPLACFEEDQKLLVVASNGGADSQPAWYLNLQANPRVEVRLRGHRDVRIARTANAEERLELWPKLVERNRVYRAYEKRTSREIPIVILEVAG